MSTNIQAAISNYESRLATAVANAADPEAMPGAGLIGLLRRDLSALYEMHREAEGKAELDRKLAAIDAEQ